MNIVCGVLNAGAADTPSIVQKWGEIMLPVLGHEIMAYLAFAFYVFLIVGGGLVAVMARNLVRAMLGLVVTFMGVAGMYLLMASPFMAFMQLLIYIGAICVLIFFAIMMVKNTSSGEEMNMPGLGQLGAALMAGGLLVVFLAPIIVIGVGKINLGGQGGGPPLETPLAELGEGLLSFYVAPFELISVILLVAMAGGVFLAWDKKFQARK